MTTLSEQIDAQIKSLQEQLGVSVEEHKERRTIDERIKDLREQLGVSVEEHKERKTIDERIKDLREQLNGSQKEQLSLPKTKEEKDSCLDTFHKEEKSF